jgi:hypothetical protein
MMIATSTRAPNGSGGTEAAVTVTACHGAVVVTVEEAHDGACTVHVRRGNAPILKISEPPRSTA